MRKDSRLEKLGCQSYTFGMKTAISVPDKIFRDAEIYAKRFNKSRSQLYTEAISEYLARHTPDAVTSALNMVVDDLDNGNEIDSFAALASRKMLPRVEW